jgi:hypothetical protein
MIKQNLFGLNRLIDSVLEQTIPNGYGNTFGALLIC